MAGMPVYRYLETLGQKCSRFGKTTLLPPDSCIPFLKSEAWAQLLTSSASPGLSSFGIFPRSVGSSTVCLPDTDLRSCRNFLYFSSADLTSITDLRFHLKNFL